MKLEKYLFDLETKINSKQSKYIFALFVMAVIGIII